MMCVMTLSVVMRYVFNAPLIWPYKLISVYFLVGAFYPIISHTLRENEHIAIDVMVPYLKKQIIAPIRAFGYLASSVLLAVICWLYWDRFVTSWVGNELVSMAIPLPLWVTYGMVCVGSIFVALRCLVKARDEMRDAFAKDSSK
ncbi:hypothetical protein DBV39_15280 [Orrella marina]|uniref:TRAP transporter small permease protein n=2 Tax=Orrella marina TaxID=2163011 RepID=A0A2R4XM49_9BURK|nr:hypothetical protein DBV39_15280 [Orrella marina]